MSHGFSFSPGAEPDPGAEGWEEPYPAGADAPGGGGAPFWWTGSCGHTRQRLHTNLPLQAAVLLLLVAKHKQVGGQETIEMSRVLPWQ